MSGDTTTAALTEAVARAGGFPFVAGGYLSAEAMAAQVDRMRETTDIFGVNLFAPNPVPIDRVAFDSFVAALTPAAAERGLSLDPEPVDDDDHYDDKLDWLIAHPVPLGSTTFNLPTSEAVDRPHPGGPQVVATGTTAAAARAAAARERCLSPEPAPAHRDAHYGNKLDWLLAHPVPLVSTTFNLPTSEAVDRLHAVGTQVVATVTTAAEARAAAERGVDGLIVQGH